MKTYQNPVTAVLPVCAGTVLCGSNDGGAGTLSFSPNSTNKQW